MAKAGGSRRTAWLRHVRLTWLQANGSTKARAAAAHTATGIGSGEDKGRVRFAERGRRSRFDPWRRDTHTLDGFGAGRLRNDGRSEKVDGCAPLSVARTEGSTAGFGLVVFDDWLLDTTARRIGWRVAAANGEEIGWQRRFRIRVFSFLVKMMMGH
ncbi:hypothetical protein E5676_scaffold92G00060 [Cucumis melo var. makuwa]|uniref:Uncharacterized protein n=1 Tax=Cucumis melo var. makuwa TaxID=1194695 RepID=A0A5D3BFJ4_CUCMM|nr:hypothetical protein E5676_scaffold92G00060 [Cucumis melo var. makuwa]